MIFCATFMNKISRPSVNQKLNLKLNYLFSTLNKMVIANLLIYQLKRTFSIDQRHIYCDAVVSPTDQRHIHLTHVAESSAQCRIVTFT